MVFQDALSALNPVFPVGWQIAETPPQSRGPCRGPTPRTRAIELMDRVQIPAAASTRAGLPAPVLGRHAPARDDRDGARPRTRRC